jgi:hypothetical protein
MEQGARGVVKGPFCAFVFIADTSSVSALALLNERDAGPKVAKFLVK